MNGIGAPVVGKKRSRNKEPDDNTGPILDCFVSAVSILIFLKQIAMRVPLNYSTNEKIAFKLILLSFSNSGMLIS